MFLPRSWIGGLVAASGLWLQACGTDPVGQPALSSAAGQAGTGANVAGLAGAGTSPAGAGPVSGAAGAELAGGAGVGGMSGSDGGAGGTSLGGAGAAGAAEIASGGTAGAPPIVLDEALRQRAASGILVLQAWYNQNTGLFDKNDWWTSGNQLEAIIDYTRETGDMQYFADIENTFSKNSAKNFDKWGYYDDDGWWCIVWIKAYDLTQQQKYLDMAKVIFKRMADSWDTKCKGGIYWRNAKDKKNAIPNTLFMQAAAKLHLRTPGDMGTGSYLDFAQRTWSWFKSSGLLQPNGLIYDSLNNLSECKAEGPVFTYNQGVAVGALTDLAAASGDDSLLDEASAIVHGTMTLMQVNGILKEAPCGGEVCTQFKGVFFRNLLSFYRVRPAVDLQQYMRAHSDRIWNYSRNDKNQLGYEWHLPAFDGPSVMRQGSADDALIAAYAASNPLPP
jgi:predicted alpha-1,6-mannanase (GH76 family)